MATPLPANKLVRAKRPKRKACAPTDRDYVDNEKFTAAVVDYAARYKLAKASGLPLPRMSNYIGECVLKIAERTMGSPNFAGYSFRQEMVNDSVLNAVKYLHNFDASYAARSGKTKNAFSYVTTICWNSAIFRIKAEKKESDGKKKIILNSGIIDAIAEHQNSDEDGQSGNYLKYLIDSIDAKASADEQFAHYATGAEEIVEDGEEILVDNFHEGDVGLSTTTTKKAVAYDLLPESIEDVIDNSDE